MDRETVWKSAILITMLIASTAVTALSQEQLPVESLDLAVGQSQELNLSVRNRLSTEDKIILRFKGRALQNGLVQLTVDESPSDVTCTPDFRNCNVTVAAQSSREIVVSFEASQTGQDTVVIEGTSDQTQLSGEEDLTVSVNPLSSSQDVAAPGMTGMYIVASGIIAGLILLFIARKEEGLKK